MISCCGPSKLTVLNMDALASSTLLMGFSDPLISTIQNTCPGALNGAPAVLFLTLINSLFAAQCSLVPPTVTNYGTTLKTEDQFDFIIIGSGPTGSVIANRLSENPKLKVLLLEAGGTPSVGTQIPGMYNILTDSPEDWTYRTEPEQHACRGLKDSRCKITSGKVLGGSSSIKVMSYIRSNKYDSIRWKKLGIKEWGWSTVLKYYKKSEDNVEFGNITEYHSTGGYLNVNSFVNPSLIKDILKKAAEESGYAILEDINRGKHIGYADTQGTVANGIRNSAYSAFLCTANNRSNLYIAKNAFVTKVLINEDKKAYGVKVIINTKEIKLKARKEVILSAGAIGSPKILLLSGVGPKNHLKQVNVPVVQNLPVGQNLQDQMSFIGFFVALKNNITESSAKENDLDTIQKYFLYKDGPLATIGLSSFYGFISTLRQKYPNVQLTHQYFKKGFLASYSTYLTLSGMDEVLIKTIIEYNNKYGLLQIIPTILYPKSRGNISLTCHNPLDMPRIYGKYLLAQADVRVMINAITFLKKLINTTEIKKYDPEIVDLKIPTCSPCSFNTSYYKCAIKYWSVPSFNSCGTCKMGCSKDKTAVVDYKLKVKGISGLRVADSSIFPLAVTGNRNILNTMVGERAADLIKHDCM